MLFNSVHFLVFFPVVLLVYFVLPHRARWVWLLVASYYFYMAWSPKYALLMTVSILITYLSGLLIQRAERLANQAARRRLKRLWVFLSFFLNLGILFLFKYFHFAFDSLRMMLSAVNIQLAEPGFSLLLPVGISFYTFQALSYTVDVYRGEIYPEKNLARYALFVSFFPQLVAGPIERSKNLLSQLAKRHDFDYDNARNGLLRMLWGFFQKLVIADRAAILVNTVFDNPGAYAGVEVAMAVFMFAMQIYCDFSGYSDIAIGAAQMLGIRLMENFRQPYLSASIREFWHNWHISLSTWFRDYLYIPLGGGRVSAPRRYFNTMLTFLLSGLWHGANWSYVIWGGLHGAFQVIGDLLKKPRRSLYGKLRVNTSAFSFRLGQVVVTFVLVCFAWIFFRADSAREAFLVIGRLFSEFNYWVLFNGGLFALGLDHRQFSILAVALLVLLAFSLVRRRGLSPTRFLARQNAVFRWLFYYLAVAAVLFYGVYGNDYALSQFIYFQF